MYQGLYFSSPESIEDYSYRPVQELQYGHLPAVRDLVFQNRFRLKDAFVALHAPDLLDADDDLYVGQPETAVEIQGPDGARAALIIEEGTSPDAPRIQVVVPFVCWGHPLSDDEPNFVVPLDDLCQALRAADTRRQCSAKLLRRAKAGLPESLANAPEVPPSVVTTTTTPTTIPGPTLPLPPPGPPPTSDGVCPRVGQPCDPLLPVVDPDCRCVR